MDNVVSYGEIAEVRDEGGHLRFAAGDWASSNVSIVNQIRAPKRTSLAGGAAVSITQVENLHAVGDSGAYDDRRLQVSGKVAGLGIDGGAAGRLRTRAEAIRDLILLQEAG